MDNLRQEAINPLDVVNPRDDLFTRTPIAAKEDWVAANAHIIHDIGVRNWLGELLDVLSQNKSEYDGHDMADPTLVITISDSIIQRGSKEPVGREAWIETNTKLMHELGTPEWLWALLDVLESGNQHP